MSVEQTRYDIVSHLEACADRALDAADQILARLGGWLIAGHAGGLLLCLNTLIDNRIPEGVSLTHIVVSFSVGLFSAFLSMTLVRSALLHQARIQRLQAFALREPEHEKRHVAEVSDLHIENRAGELLASISMSVSVAAFLFALNQAILLAQNTGI